MLRHNFTNDNCSRNLDAFPEIRVMPAKLKFSVSFINYVPLPEALTMLLGSDHFKEGRAEKTGSDFYLK